MTPTRNEARPVPAAIESWVLAQPQAPAIVGDHGEVSYRELWDEASRWAGALSGHTFGPDAVVGVLVRRGTAAPVRHLAAWWVGAGYLPLDPSLPRDRIATIIAEADCRVVLTTEELAESLPAGVEAVTAPGPAIAPVAWEARRLAYVIYTSGSTGKPKGVEIGHASLAALADWYRAFYRLEAGSRTSMFANLAFDCLVVDVWPALSAGGAVAVPDDRVLTDPKLMGEFLERCDVQHTEMPTAMFERFLRSGQDPGHVATIETGADRLRLWPPADYPAAVYNTYGPTEATVQVTVSEDLRGYHDRTQLPPLGRPLPGAQVAVVRPDGTTVEHPGEDGELVVSGPVLARGYRNAPGLTAAAFLGDGGRDGERRYRTGDVCRWNKAGELEFVKRADEQVQIHGFRVELGEIEQRMMQFPGAGLAAVLAVEDEDDPHLLGWVDGAVDGAELIAYLGVRLPPYMIPRRLTVLDRLPMTPNGKVDKQRLRGT
jgi:amino acid adenylation domain-containing protein